MSTITVELCGGNRKGIEKQDFDANKPDNENYITINLVPEKYKLSNLKITVGLLNQDWEAIEADKYKLELQWSRVDMFYLSAGTVVKVVDTGDNLYYGYTKLIASNTDICDLSSIVVTGSKSGDFHQFVPYVVNDGLIGSSYEPPPFEHYASLIPGEVLWLSYRFRKSPGFGTVTTGYRAPGITGGTITDRQWYIEDVVYIYEVQYEGLTGWFFNSQCTILNVGQWVFLNTDLVTSLENEEDFSIPYGTELDNTKSFILPMRIQGHGPPCDMWYNRSKDYSNIRYAKGRINSIDRAARTAFIHCTDLGVEGNCKFYCLQDGIDPTSGDQFILGDSVLVMIVGRYTLYKIIGVLPHTLCPLNGTFLIATDSNKYLCTGNAYSDFDWSSYVVKNEYGISMDTYKIPLCYSAYGPMTYSDSGYTVINGIPYLVTYTTATASFTLTIYNTITQTQTVHLIPIPDNLIAQCTPATSNGISYMGSYGIQERAELNANLGCFEFADVVIPTNMADPMVGLSIYFNADCDELTCLIRSASWSGGGTGLVRTEHFWYLAEGDWESASTRVLRTEAIVIKIISDTELSITNYPVSYCTSNYTESWTSHLSDTIYNEFHYNYSQTWSISGNACIGGVYNGNVFSPFMVTLESIDYTATRTTDQFYYSTTTVTGGLYKIIYCNINGVDVPISIMASILTINHDILPYGTHVFDSYFTGYFGLHELRCYGIGTAVGTFNGCSEVHRVNNNMFPGLDTFVGLNGFFLSGARTYAYCNKFITVPDYVVAANFILNHKYNIYYLISTDSSILDTNGISFPLLKKSIPIENKLFLRS